MAAAPLTVLLYDRAFLSRSFREALRARAALYAGLAGSWLVLAALLASGAHSESAGFGLSVTPWEYARTQAGVIVHYLRLSFWPNPLVVDYYDWPVARTAAAVVPAGAPVIGLLAATLWAARRRPWLGFLGAWFFLILAPTSSVLALVGEFAAERCMYVPLAAVVTLVVIAVHAALGRLFRHVRSPDVLRRTVEAALLLAVAVPLGCLTARRNEDYRSEVGIWADIVAKRPNNSRAQNNLGGSLEAVGLVKEAAAHFAEAVRIKPTFAVAHNNLGRALVKQGRTDEAVPHFSQAVRLKSNSAEAHSRLGTTLHRQGRLEEAIAQYSEAVRLRPNDAWTHYNLWIARLQQGKVQEAAQHFEAALRLDPKHPLAGRALEKVRSRSTRS